ISSGYRKPMNHNPLKSLNSFSVRHLDKIPVFLESHILQIIVKPVITGWLARTITAHSRWSCDDFVPVN
ncbi:hypothetical protein, partial [Komagataeibacter rhaeticus]|uniref:hypothetical protein n=1 Tax=Komagataeibacter rhaeticus TaxID=215221 RepID=UPI002490C5B8